MADLEKELADAQELMMAGDCSGAVKKYNRILKSHPNVAEAHFGRAEAGLGDSGISTDDIMASYRKAIELDGKNPLYWSSFAVYLIEQGKFEDAEVAYNKAAEMDPDNSSYYFSEFAVEYASRAPSSIRAFVEGKDIDEKTRAVLEKKEEGIKKKALQYMLRSIEMSEQEAKKLL